MHHPHILVWKAVREKVLSTTVAFGETHRFMPKQ
jgi:hypothetical protein